MKKLANTSDEELLDSLVTIGYQVANDVMLDFDQQLMPMWVIVAENGGILEILDIIGTPWKDEAEKVISLTAIKLKLKMANARAYSVVSEVWQAAAPPGFKPTDKRPWRTVEEAPNRREALMVMAATRNGTQRMSSWEIKRDEKGKCIGFGEEEKTEAAGGRMLELFK